MRAAPLPGFLTDLLTGRITGKEHRALNDAEFEERFGEPRLMRRPGMSPWTPPSPALSSTLLGREKGPLCGEVIVGSPASLTPAQRLRVAFG
ncbi:hypothetical protein P6B95_04790 [Streptomyces atratus]|uniref:hypothetical protein n=1 Tax=Streptomyces atratus TaxID=1893 RepID=UPI002AC34FF5|nr:hypothetical protein [Streptomyces atratus]WPW26798.1 hypothetical protein P6B95_04790 [Streptomyces atratus]